MQKKTRHGLTFKQNRFAEAYARCGNASEAYREAYDAEKMKPATIWTESCTMLKNPKVTARIDALNEQIEEQNRLNGSKLREIVRSGLLNEAKTAENASARISALKLLGELSDVQAFAPQRIETQQKITTENAQKNLEEALADAMTDPTVVQLFEK